MIALAKTFGSDPGAPGLEAGTFRIRDPLNQQRRFIPLRLDDAPIKGSLTQFLYINWPPQDANRSVPSASKPGGCPQYLVADHRPLPERWTVYFDRGGVPKEIDKKVNAKDQGKDVAKNLEELSIAKKK